MVLPALLAGPIVRRVEPQGASFWIALSSAAKVTARVWAGQHVAGDATGAIATGEAETRRFLPFLHVALVTARPQAGVLAPGMLHSYDLSFTAQDGAAPPPIDLAAAGLLQDQAANAGMPGRLALGYAPGRLPSFVMPPALTNGLRFAQTGCRSTNATGPDATAWLDELIGEQFGSPLERPQTLILTGDQIYADDLGASLLPMLGALASDLLGGAVEHVPVPTSTGVEEVGCTLSAFPALRRNKLVRGGAGFSTTSGDNHLVGFAEFAAMYLAAFSPSVWRDLASADAVFTGDAGEGGTQALLTDWERIFGSTARWREQREPFFEVERKRVERYRDAVPKVARALANIATYAIFDDHEVTDDYNLNRAWVNRVYTKPLGRAIIRNGVSAYSLFQAWGNDPAAFGADPNKVLLDSVVNRFAGAGPFAVGDTTAIDQAIGLSDGEASKRANFHYAVPMPTVMLRVLDTRTRRGFEGQGTKPPKLLGDSLDAQLPAGPLRDGRELFICVSAAPILGPALVERIGTPIALAAIDAKVAFDTKAAASDERIAREVRATPSSEHFDAESWVADEGAFEAVLERLATYDRAVVLAGDVHYSVTLALDYWRKPPATPARILQLTASAARNQMIQLVPAMTRAIGGLQRLLAGEAVVRLGWKGEAGVTLPPGASVAPGRRARLRRKPALVPASGWPAGTTMDATKPMDWAWRLELVRDVRPDAELPEPLRPEPLPAAIDAGDPLAAVAMVAAAHQKMAMADRDHRRSGVFVPNLSVFRFVEREGGLVLEETLHAPPTQESDERLVSAIHLAPLRPTTAPLPGIEALNA